MAARMRKFMAVLVAALVLLSPLQAYAENDSGGGQTIEALEDASTSDVSVMGESQKEADKTESIEEKGGGLGGDTSVEEPVVSEETEKESPEEEQPEETRENEEKANKETSSDAGESKEAVEEVASSENNKETDNSGFEADPISDVSEEVPPIVNKDEEGKDAELTESKTEKGTKAVSAKVPDESGQGKGKARTDSDKEKKALEEPGDSGDGQSEKDSGEENLPESDADNKEEFVMDVPKAPELLRGSEQTLEEEGDFESLPEGLAGANRLVVKSVVDFYDVNSYPTQSDTLIGITSLRNVKAVSTNSDVQVKGSRICIPSDYFRSEDIETEHVLTNVGYVTFSKCAMTTDGQFVDMTYVLDEVSIQFTRWNALDGASYELADSVRDVTIGSAQTENGDVTGYWFWAGFLRDADGARVTRQTALPRTRITAHIRLTYSGTETAVPNPEMLLMITDLDVVNQLAEYNESMQFASGWKSTLYVPEGYSDYISVTNGNSRFTANRGSDDESRRLAAVTAVMESPTASFIWRGGNNCGTIVTPKVREVPVTDAVVQKYIRKVTNGTAEYLAETTQAHGTSVTYDIQMDLPNATTSTAFDSVLLEDTFSPMVSFTADGVRMWRDGENVTSNWEITVTGSEATGLKLTATMKDTRLGGTIHCRLTAKITGDMEGCSVKKIDGVTHAIIPNKAKLTVKPKTTAKKSMETQTVYTYVPGTSIRLVKKANKASISPAVPGDIIQYTFEIKNTGKFTLRDVKLTDTLPVTNLTLDWAGSSDPDTGSSVLSSNETLIGTASYTITKADIKRGYVVNSATVKGKDKGNVYVEDTSEVRTDLSYNASISLRKRPTPAPGMEDHAKPGDLITYRFIGKNTGNVILTNVKIEDPMEGLSEIAYDWSVATGEGILAPGEYVYGTATYAITAADIIAGRKDNTARIEGKDPVDETVEATWDASVPIGAAPEIEVVKDVLEGIIEDPKVGDVIHYQIVGTNKGIVTLSEVTLSDLLEETTELPLLPDWSEATAEGTLAPGEKVRATAEYEITQADIDRGTVHNVVTISGKSPKGETVTDEDDADTVLVPHPSIKVTKEAKETEIKNAKPGDTIHYEIIGTNDGNVTLKEVSLADLLEETMELPLSLDWSDAETEETLAPGETVRATAEYEITKEDIERGTVHNVVTIQGTSPDGETVTDEDDEDTVLLTPVRLFAGGPGRTGSVLAGCMGLFVLALAFVTRRKLLR